MNLIEITEILNSDSNYGQLLSEIRKGKSGTRVQVIDEAVPFLTASIWTVSYTHLRAHETG